GRSETGGLPLHAKKSAEDLAVLLKRLEIPRPYLVVGHSYGGAVARLFAAMYPEDIGGLILEDCQHEDILEEQRKTLKGADLKQLEKMVEMMSSKGEPTTELGFIMESRKQLHESPPLPVVPFVVITSGDRSKAMPPMFSEEGKTALIALGLDLQKRLVDLIPGGKHIIAENAGHNIHAEKPEVLVKPILEMLEKARAR
ncbi:MAG TPA: alpha/beta hydrolase, partial [Candidatus Krumholzibacterium sp.]|nr:alpha/beta hydrolase [Candidatus Krumholzibacterium sp.]